SRHAFSAAWDRLPPLLGIPLRYRFKPLTVKTAFSAHPAGNHAGTSLSHPRQHHRQHHQRRSSIRTAGGSTVPGRVFDCPELPVGMGTAS
ncbi:unnamed protein product, partial [Ixodes hexagonus]